PLRHRRGRQAGVVRQLADPTPPPAATRTPSTTTGRRASWACAAAGSPSPRTPSPWTACASWTTCRSAGPSRSPRTAAPPPHSAPRARTGRKPRTRGEPPAHVRGDPVLDGVCHASGPVGHLRRRPLRLGERAYIGKV